jgi:integrase
MARLKKRADGRLRRSYTDPKTGQKKYVYGATEREVNRKYDEAVRTACAPEQITFAAVADKWWRYNEARISPTSIRGYRIAYQRAVNFFEGEYITDITAMDISKFLNSLAREGYAKKTVKNHKIVINRILNYAVVEGYIKTSPSRDAELPRGLKQTRRKAAPPEDEQKVRDTADVWLFPYMALMTGMRKGELLALQWCDVDFKSNIISVYKSLYYDNAPHIKTTKTEAGTRRIPILAPLREVLIKHAEGVKPSHYVFTDDGEHPLTNKRYRTLLKHYQEKTGMTSTTHQFRKSFATAAARENIPPKVLQSILGHKDIATTMNIYAEVRDESLQDAADILNKSSFAKGKKQ